MVGRREAVIGLGATLVGVAAGPAVLFMPVAPRPEGDVLKVFLRLTEPDEAAALSDYLPRDAEIGRTPRESVERLIATIDGPFDDGSQLSGRVAACIRQDYAEGRILIVGGWALSLTEARLAALWRHG